MVETADYHGNLVNQVTARRRKCWVFINIAKLEGLLFFSQTYVPPCGRSDVLNDALWKNKDEFMPSGGTPG